MMKRNLVKKLLSATLSVAMLVCLIVPNSVAAETHSHCICNGSTDIGDHTEHSSVSFTEWTSTSSMPTTEGNYVLTKDVTIDDGWEPVGNTILCLNGHTLKYSNSSGTDSVIVVNSGVTLTICDCQNNSGQITGGTGYYDGRYTNYHGGGILNSGTVYMYGGSITGNSVNAWGGGLFNYGTFVLYGGSVSNNSCGVYGGGIFNAGLVKVYGGTISENTAGNFGAIGGYGSTELYGGSVINNSVSSSDGIGGIMQYTNYTPITISGSVIINGNTANGEPSNLGLKSSLEYILDVKDLASDSVIGITIEEWRTSGDTLVFTDGGSEYLNCFFSDKDEYLILEQNGSIAIHAHGNYDYPEWTWDENDQCFYAVFTCECSTKTETVAYVIDFETVSEPTCTEAGTTDFELYAEINDEEYYGSINIATSEALGHTTEIQNAKEATITEDGYTGDEVCTVCGEVVKYGEVIPALGMDITGTINVSDSDATTDMTVTAVAEDGTETSVTATSMGEYTIEGLASGTYTLVVSGGKYVPREYSIEVDIEDITQDVSLNPYGDVNGDGNVTTADVGLANSHAKGVKILEDYEFDSADVNIDESVTTADVGKINSHAKGVALLW